MRDSEDRKSPYKSENEFKNQPDKMKRVYDKKDNIYIYKNYKM
jgi:hypothetical protein